ncbi:rab GTPase-binding effector protein 2 isoform X1 [Brienomyrus brachyistius]|uniref:rab GTPase-binding effector protein 2 isoform X1 n=1 Tax=Brienomyrus brachyistius TaxID=42636 RepID=UPI0020B2653A|nr:rab GTPase-binding effector protein 2 isoform X1 [Brienomyrus brachyistius]
MEKPEGEPFRNAPEEPALVASLQAKLADCRAQLEHWQGVATICELSKQEELSELQKQCDQEIQSLQEALRETASQYETKIAALLAERTQWRSSMPVATNRKNGREVLRDGDGFLQAEADAERSRGLTGSPGDRCDCTERAERDSGERPEEDAGMPEGDVEGPLSLTEGYFSQHCDTSSLSSFSLDTPLLTRRPQPQDDTASLLSTGTLVPEAIYLPPPGHRLVAHADWDALHSQVAELQGDLARLREERAELEKELGRQTSETQQQVSVLQSQVQTSETLLQDLQKSFAQSQSAVQGRLAELSLSHRRVCAELSRLRASEPEASQERVQQADVGPSLQVTHCEERLRIEIVNLKEQLEQRTEESEVLEVKLSSLKTETDRIQSENDKLQSELQICRTELSGLRVALSHLQKENKTQSSDKSALEQQCLELRSQVISLRSQLDNSQTVQMDFVQLSQSLQVKLELIRQAGCMDQVREVLGEGPIDGSSKVTDTS